MNELQTGYMVGLFCGSIFGFIFGWLCASARKEKP